MDDDALLLRIRAVVVSTRAALRSLGADSDQRDDVMRRAEALLDELQPEIMRYGGAAPRSRLTEARSELSAMSAADAPSSRSG
jgi:hypothetical protein